MRPRPRVGDRRGLTLIELVLTMTILAIAGALVTGALTTALRSWQSGLRAGREELVARIVLERLAAQLRAAVPAPARRENADAVAFDGGSDHLRFVTMAAGAVPTHVFYGLREAGGGNHLVYREHPWPDKEFFDDGKARREEDVVEVTGFSVRLVKRTEQSAAAAGAAGTGAGSGTSGAAGNTAAGGVVPEEWSPLDGKLPARVEIEIEVRGEGLAEPRTYAVAVPVLAERP